MIQQVTKNILYEKVGGIYDLKAVGGVKSMETRSYQVIVLYLAHFIVVCVLNIDYYIFPPDKTLFPCFLHH